MGHKQSEVPFDSGERRHRQLGMRERRTSDGFGIDRIRLSPHPVRTASHAHHPRRHTHRGLPAGDQVALEVSGDVTAVLHGEPALLVEVARPAEEALESSRAGLHRELSDHLAGHPVDRDGGVGLFVRVDPHYDHSWSPFLDAHTGWQDHRRTRLSGADASSYEVTPAGLRRRRAAQRMKVIPLAGDTQATSQPAVGRRLSRADLGTWLRDHPDTELLATASLQLLHANRGAFHASFTPPGRRLV